MWCSDWLLNFFVRIRMAIGQGFTEYCERGCLIGASYLVNPNYHSCERRVWFVIFGVGSCIGSTLIYNYMRDYSQNVFRIVDEIHYSGQPVQYPSLGVCPAGVENDAVMMTRLEEALNNSLYKKFPALGNNSDLKHVVHMLAFQNLYRKKKFNNFLRFAKTLAPPVQQYLENFNYKILVDNVTYKCEEFFIKCSWLDRPVDCCSVFPSISTMLGKCFLFNSFQTGKTMASEMVKQIEIFKEPFPFEINFSKPAEIFILNNRDIPQKINSFNNFAIKEKGTALTLGFNIYPTVNDATLLDLDRKTLRCINTEADTFRSDKMYGLESFTTCLTERFYIKQMETCQCINLYGWHSEGTFCNLSQFRCLELNGFISPKLIPAAISKLKLQCTLTCEDAAHAVGEIIYSKIADADKQDVLSLRFILSHFPIRHKRRQAIRQDEDKMASFSNALGLFMGLNVINIIEFIYLTCRAFWKYNKKSSTQDATEPQGYGRRNLDRPLATLTQISSSSQHMP